MFALVAGRLVRHSRCECQTQAMEERSPALLHPSLLQPPSGESRRGERTIDEQVNEHLGGLLTLIQEVEQSVQMNCDGGVFIDENLANYVQTDIRTFVITLLR
jgi:hypothetical protein